MSASTVELDIAGMHCASCVSRVEGSLNDLGGVEATVNLATHQALVRYDDQRLTPTELVAAVETTGYHATVIDEGGSAVDVDEAAALLPRVVVGVVLSIPVVLLAMVRPWQFDGWQWWSLVLATPVVTWVAWPLHRSAWVAARHRATTMDTLVSLGVLAAYGWSLYALFFTDAGDPSMRMPFSWLPSRDEGAADIYLEVAAGVATVVLLGRYLEARAKRRSGSALRELLELGAKEVGVLGPDGEEQRVPADRLRVGDRFLVRPGETVATDGVVVEGRASVDQATITGESVPVPVGPGDLVVGATVAVGGRLVVEATAVGADTQVARIGRLVREAQAGKAQVQRLADRVSAVFVPIVIALSLATLLGWWLLGDSTAAAFEAAVAVLIIACPCALGLATPTALLVGTGRGAQLGILIRGPQVLESTRRVDTVVLDKTGTVTLGAMEVTDVLVAEGTDPGDVRRYAAAVEEGSEHPIGSAVVRSVRGEQAGGSSHVVPSVEQFQSHEGRGVSGRVEGHEVVVGSRALLADLRDLAEDSELSGAVAAEQAAGRIVVRVGWDGRVRGAIALADAVKPTSAEAVRRLRALGLRPILLTGDHKVVADEVAAEVGIDHADVIADVLPIDKVATIRRLQGEGRTVAMVGDGVNDAAALAAADLGLAIGTGTDIAIEASDLTLVRGDLRAAPDAIELARRTLGTIKGNLFWAFGYIVAAIPLAAAGLLNPLVAGGAMAVSSLFVVLNSLRLRGFTPGRASGPG